jgi:hypothetical protein
LPQICQGCLLTLFELSQASLQFAAFCVCKGIGPSFWLGPNGVEIIPQLLGALLAIGEATLKVTNIFAHQGNIAPANNTSAKSGRRQSRDEYKRNLW